jgi:hypothetical protein
MKLSLSLVAAVAAAAACSTAANAASVEESVSANLASAVRQAAELLDRMDAQAVAEAEVDAEAHSALESSVQGIQNCANKCQNMFNVMQYLVNTQPGPNTGGSTNEYLACIAGCNICGAMIAKADPDKSKCFTICKNTDWLSAVDENGNATSIVKGIIEPDKACEMGCVINTCQVVCQGGTTDMNPTPDNANSWWGSGVGCSLKTGGVRPGGYYSQNSAYNYFNAPAGGAGQAECCAQAFSLCNYSGDTSSVNYQNVLGQASKFCKSVPGAGTSQPAICAYFANPANNCGTPLS